MKRIFHKAKNFKDEENWDIFQHLQMRSEERQEAAKELRERVYGKKTIDVKESMRQKWNRPIFQKIYQDKEALERPKDLEDLTYLKKAMEKKKERWIEK